MQAEPVAPAEPKAAVAERHCLSPPALARAAGPAMAKAAGAGRSSRPGLARELASEGAQRLRFVAASSPVAERMPCWDPLSSAARQRFEPAGDPAGAPEWQQVLARSGFVGSAETVWAAVAATQVVRLRCSVAPLGQIG